jgi:hypothetical protein
MSSLAIFSFSARRITLSLSIFAGLLLFAYFGAVYVRVGFEYQRFLGVVRLFDLDAEANIPTLFSTFLFWFNSALLFLIYRLRRRETDGKEGRVWLFLGVLFCFLGIDEAVSIHELFNRHPWVRPTGVLHFVWVVPYGITTFVLTAIMLPWFLKLDGRTRWLFASSAIIFVSGAVGMEMISGRYLESVNEKRGLVYQLMVAVEETLEMAGLIVFNYGLLVQLQRFAPVSVSFKLVRDEHLPGDAEYSRTAMSVADGDSASPVRL